MERILVVEDDPINRKLLEVALRRSGYETDTAEDGQKAWEKLQQHNGYDVVVADRCMPHIDGLQLSQRMQAEEKLRPIPIIMQTGSDKPEEVVEGIAAGVFYYLTKPYKEEALLRLIKSAVTEKRRNEWFEQRANRQKDALGTFVQGEFRIKTPEEAQNIAFLLGTIFPRPVMAVSGLYELLINAIEHGNLGLGFTKKSQTPSVSAWEEEIEKRLRTPPYSTRKVAVRFSQNNDSVEVTIEDEGEGFDWRPYMEIEPARATQSNGRGIAKANLLCFDKITYLNNGNKVNAMSRLAAKH